MNPVKNFSDYVEEGTVKKQYADLSRAKFLAKEYAEKVLEFMNKAYSKLKGMLE